MIARPVEERDWTRIAWLASDEVQEADHAQLESDWLRRRREFAGERVDSVLERGGEVIAYCALENVAEFPGWRVFVVLDWSTEDVAVQEAAYRQVEQLAARVGARHLWLRELVGDVALLEFFDAKGFALEKRYRHGDLEMVNISKSL